MKIHTQGYEAFHVQPWVWALVVSLVIQFGGAVWVTATMSEKIDSLALRVERLERQIDSLVNVTRSPQGYSSPPVSGARQ